MSTKFFMNAQQDTLLNKFEGIFTNNGDIVVFDALVGFFRASTFFTIRPLLDDVPKSGLWLASMLIKSSQSIMRKDYYFRLIRARRFRNIQTILTEAYFQS